MSKLRGQSSLFIVSYFPFADYEIQFTLNLSNVNKLKMWSRHNAFNDNLESSRRTFIYNKPNFTTEMKFLNFAGPYRWHAAGVIVFPFEATFQEHRDIRHKT